VTGLTAASVEARGFEAQWRGRIGDIAGAALAFARLGETIASCPELTAHRAGHWLAQAGKYNIEQLDDPGAAERYLAQALRRLPKDPAIAEAYRVAAARVAQPRLTAAQTRVVPEVNTVASEPLGSTASDRSQLFGEQAPVPDALRHQEQQAVGGARDQAPEVGYEELTEIQLEQRVETLRAQLLATSQAPEAVVNGLVEALGRLGRLEEAYALLRAQYDDSSGAVQARLGQALADVLARLIEWSRDQGREDDSELYALTLAALQAE
jgi:hypothetical protein